MAALLAEFVAYGDEVRDARRVALGGMCHVRAVDEHDRFVGFLCRLTRGSHRWRYWRGNRDRRDALSLRAESARANDSCSARARARCALSRTVCESRSVTSSRRSATAPN